MPGSNQNKGIIHEKHEIWKVKIPFFREYWTCQDSTTDLCEKTTKAVDVQLELETTRRLLI